MELLPHAGFKPQRLRLTRAPQRVGGTEGATQRQRLSPLGHRQVSVAAAQRQPVGLTHGRAHGDLDRQVEVPDHPADQRHLLDVLLPEHRDIRLHQVEELGHHRQHAGEVPRPHGAFPPFRGRARHHAGLGAGGVHHLHPGNEERGHAPAGGEGPVPVQVPRVPGKVLAGAELERVDEHAHEHRRRRPGGEVHQREVPGMQRAHRGHEAHPPARAPLRLAPGAEGGDVLQLGHHSKLCSFPGYLPSCTSSAKARAASRTLPARSA